MLFQKHPAFDTSSILSCLFSFAVDVVWYISFPEILFTNIKLSTFWIVQIGSSIFASDLSSLLSFDICP